MKTIGLIGGMSWESSLVYYRLINQMVREELGGLHSAQCVLFSVDFQVIERLQSSGQWQLAGTQLAQVGRRLEAAGADCVILCTNTMHKIFNVIEEAINIPTLHIADVTARAISEAGMDRVGLLGTRFTMEEDFFKQRLRDQSGIEMVVPDMGARKTVDRIIYTELCQGQIRSESKSQLIDIVNRMHETGINGLVLGCTELGLLLTEADVPVQLFDTTSLHARAAVDWCLA